MDYPVIFPNKGDYVVEIPFPYTQFTDTIFFLSQSSQESDLFIPDDCYTRIDDNRISFPKDNVLGIDENSEIRFTFIHKDNKRWLGKTEFHITIKEFGQREFYLPNSVYSQLVDIRKRIYVFYNRKRQTQGIHYRFEPLQGKIVLVNKKLKSLINDRIDIMFIHTGSKDNGGIQYLPQSGYIYLSPKEIDRNYNPNLMSVFVNGKLVDSNHIAQMSNTIYKINKDINSRYNVEVRNLSPKINSMIPYYKQHSFDQDEIVEPINTYFYCRLEVPGNIPHHRKYVKPLFNPVYFSPDLIEDTSLWINLILLKNDVDYTLNLYGDDYVEEPNEINVILQLRLKTQRDFTHNSKTAVLFTKLPSTISPINEDYLLSSIQVKTVMLVDSDNNTKDIDGIIGRLQADIRKFKHSNPIYYTLISDGFNDLTDIHILRWTITTEENNQGRLIWSKDFILEPDNKIDLITKEGNDNG